MTEMANVLNLNRATWIDYITSCLSNLACFVHTQNSHGLTSGNIHAEYFYKDFLNAIFSINLVNQNHFISNAPGFDLIDIAQSLIVQVSSQDKISKVRNSFAKLSGRLNSPMRFWYVSMTDKLPVWHLQQFQLPIYVVFDPSTDIFDNQRLVGVCKDLDNLRLQQAYNICISHFGCQTNIDLSLTQEHLLAFVQNIAFVKHYLGELPDYCNAYLDENDMYRIYSIHGCLSKHLNEMLAKASENLQHIKNSVWFDGELLILLENIDKVYWLISCECDKIKPIYVNIKRVRTLLQQFDDLIQAAACKFANSLAVDSNLIINRIQMMAN